MSFLPMLKEKSLFSSSQAKEISALLFISLCCVIFFRDAFFKGHINLVFDSYDQNYPNIAFTWRQYQSGRLPLWNPFIERGWPAYADPNFQAFYPINLLFALFRPFDLTLLNFQLIFHYFIAGSGSFFLVRAITKNHIASILSGICFMFSGYMIYHISHLTMIEGASWTPLMLFFFKKSMEEKKLFWGSATAITLALAFLAGHPQVFVYQYYLLFLYFCYHLFQQYKKSGWGTGSKKQSLLAAAVLISAGLLVMIQILPTAELTGFSTRSATKMTVSDAKVGSLHGADSLLTFIAPNYQGALRKGNPQKEPMSRYFYFGIVPLFFILVSLFHKQKSRVVFYWGLVLAGFMFAFGGVFYEFMFNYAPGLSMFRRPATIMFIPMLSLSILAGIGMDDFIKKSENGSSKKQVCLSLGFAILFILILFKLQKLAPQYIHTLACLVSSAIVLTMTVIIWLTCGKKHGNTCGILLVILSFANLLLFTGSGVFVNINYTDESKIPDNIVRFSRAMGITPERSSNFKIKPGVELRQKLFRYYISREKTTNNQTRDYIKQKNTGYNNSIFFKMFAVESYINFIPKRYLELKERFLSKQLHRFLFINSVGFVFKISTRRDNKENLSALHASVILPMISFFENAETAANKTDALNRMADKRFNPYKTVILEPSTGFDSHEFLENNQSGAYMNTTADGGSKRVDIIEYSPNKVTIKTNEEKNGFVLFNDNYYPGWHAYVDEKEVPVLRANYLFKAIPVEKGAHTVRFVFTPNRTLIAGAAISLISLILVTCPLFMELKKRRVAR